MSVWVDTAAATMATHTAQPVKHLLFHNRVPQQLNHLQLQLYLRKLAQPCNLQGS
jgi:hypothetical protein